ncbi:MAG TPA: transglycosylase SLT domain-containing protein [Anaeromyxobacteraceae bacterium]|nr:transglycosylase SLT domain-containing protein [Anaeromyxobacteraceae bacterium]
MTTAIDFATLDLRAALDFAILVEEDAQLRYERLTRLFADDAGGVGAVFRSMVATEGEHRARLAARRAALFGDRAPRIEVSALDVAVEGVDVDDDLPATPHEALRLAIAGEQRAHDFFARVLPFVQDAAARDFFAELRDDEVEHRQLLAARLDALGPEPAAAGPRRLAREALLREAPPPDAAELRRILPRVDAATRAIAAGVLVHGLAPREVADALGVSPGTVQRKWHGFLRAARQHLALGLTAAALAGCAGTDTRTPPAPAPAPASAPEVRVPDQPARPAPAQVTPTVAHAPDRSRSRARHAAAPGAARQRDEHSALFAHVHAHVAARMPRAEASMRRRIAETVIAEAKHATLDPLLVLAIIHVESSFDPDVVSHAGAVGLMQLREATFRREFERSRLTGEPDPTNPVTNVRAGVRYLRRLVDAFGDIDVALMAYNAGPNRIGGHLRQGAIPERFLSYPRKVSRELDRLRSQADDEGRRAVARSADPLPRAS